MPWKVDNSDLEENEEEREINLEGSEGPLSDIVDSAGTLVEFAADSNLSSIVEPAEPAIESNDGENSNVINLNIPYRTRIAMRREAKKRRLVRTLFSLLINDSKLKKKLTSFFFFMHHWSRNNTI